jgi:MFS family permease
MLCFTCFGLLLVLVGGNQAELATALQIDLAQSGLLVSAFTFGVGVGIVGAGPVFDRAPRRPLVVGALAWVAVVLLTASPSAGYHETLLRLVGAGLGAGAYNTVVNASLSERYLDKSAGPMAIVHGCATLGAIAGAPLFGWVALHGTVSDSFRLIGVMHALLALVCVAVPLSFGRGQKKGPLFGSGERVPYRAMLPFLGIAFAYVGIEATLTVFAVPYANSALGLDVQRGRWAISALWFGILIGRVGLYAGRKRDPGGETMVMAALLTAAVLVVGGVLRPARVELFFGAVGLGIGALYPLTMTMIGVRFPAARGTAAGLAGGAGAIGGVAVPWCTGMLGDRSGAGATIWVTAVLAVLLALCAIRLSPRRES